MPKGKGRIREHRKKSRFPFLPSALLYIRVQLDAIFLSPLLLFPLQIHRPPVLLSKVCDFPLITSRVFSFCKRLFGLRIRITCLKFLIHLFLSFPFCPMILNSHLDAQNYVEKIGIYIMPY
jgi:hypothetical protein